jgi:hypothetical protein
MEQMNTAPISPEQEKKSLRVQKLELENKIAEEQEKPQTEKTVLNIQNMQNELIVVLKNIANQDKKYVVEETLDVDPWGGDRDAQKGDQIRAQQKLRKDIVGGLR